MRKALFTVLVCLLAAHTLVLGQGILYANIDKGGGLDKEKSITIDSPPTTNRYIDTVFIDFVGTGDIQKSISNGTDFNANTGLGIVFERYRQSDKSLGFWEKLIQNLELEALINIATTLDTIKSEINGGVVANRRNFGTYILNPVSSKQSVCVKSNIYFNSDAGKFFKFINGLNLGFLSSNAVWKHKDTVTNIGALAMTINVFYEFIPDNYRLSRYRSKYSLLLGAGYTYRGIYGDITSSNNIKLRENILGSRQRVFHGLELLFGFRLNNIRAEFYTPMLKKQKGYGSIDGLTNTQFVFSIKFIGGFPLKF